MYRTHTLRASLLMRVPLEHGGSDYPLPGVMPMFSPSRMVAAGLLDAGAIEPLRRIREHNPLLFELILKRHLRDGSARLSNGVFATARQFARAAHTSGRGLSATSRM
jgi:hypothetical protein